MAIENLKTIRDYCQQQWELHEREGWGKHEVNHDELLAQEVAEHFNMSIEEAGAVMNKALEPIEKENELSMGSDLPLEGEIWMIKLEMNHMEFSVIQENIYETLNCDRMCGNEKGHEDIYRKDFFGRVLPTVTIELGEEDYHNVFKYTMLLSEEDFITLYNEIMWSEYESYGAIKYDYWKEYTKNLCRYLIKVKEEHNLKSTLDDFKNLTWYLNDSEEENLYDTK